MLSLFRSLVCLKELLLLENTVFSGSHRIRTRRNREGSLACLSLWVMSISSVVTEPTPQPDEPGVAPVPVNPTPSPPQRVATTHPRPGPRARQDIASPLMANIPTTPCARPPPRRLADTLVNDTEGSHASGHVSGAWRCSFWVPTTQTFSYLGEAPAVLLVQPRASVAWGGSSSSISG